MIKANYANLRGYVQARGGITRTEIEEAVKLAAESAVEAINATGSNQVVAVKQKGSEVLASIPDDYLQLSESIADMWKPLHLDDLLVRKQNLYSSFLEHKDGYWTRSGFNPSTSFHAVLVPVISGKKYTVSNFFDYMYFFDGKFDSKTAQRVGSGGQMSNNVTVEIPAGCSWLSITYRTNTPSDLATLMVVEGETLPTEYISGEPQWKDGIGIAPNEKNIGMLFNANAVNVVRESGKTTVTILHSSVIFSKFGNITTPNVDTTLEFTTANFLSYDINESEFFVGATRYGHNTIIIGFINHAASKTDVYLQCNYTYTDTVNQVSRTFGILFAKGAIWKRTESGCTVTLPLLSIMTEDGAIDGVPSASIDFTGISWISYDVTAHEYIKGATKAGHKLIVLGYIHPTDFAQCFLNGTIINQSKTLAFLGDSITAGSGTLKPYHVQLKSEKGWICKNYGYGGSGYLNVAVGNTGLYGTGQEGIGETINTSTGAYIADNDFYHRIDSVDSSVDALIIWGGTNDWGGGFTKEQFREGVRNVLEKAENRFTNVPIVVMTPIHREDEVDTNGEYKFTARGQASLPEFVDIILDECSRKGIPCVDLFRGVNIDPHNANMNERFFARDDKTMNDGLHPNKYAHERVMHMLLTELEKQFISRVI